MIHFCKVLFSALVGLTTVAVSTAMAGTIPYPAALDAAAVIQPAITNLQKNGLVIGNGELNAIVYASGNQLRLRVCKNDAWDGRINTTADPALPTINAAAGTFTGTIGSSPSWKNHAYPNAVPCVELSLAAPGGQTVWTNSVLDLAKAKAVVRSDADTTVIRALAQTNAFLIQSARKISFIGVNQVVSNSPGLLGGVGPSGLISGWVTNVFTGTTNGYSYARQIIYGDADASGMDIYCVAGASGTNQAVAVVTSRDSLTPLADAVAMVAGLLADANAVSTHEAVWRDFWSASGIQIGEATLQNWWYRMVYYNRCFATAGVNCFGLKAGQDMISGWHGCPKINYNIQQAYCLGGPVNHPEFIQPFVGAMNRNLPRARWLATNTFVGVTEGAFFHSDWWPFEPDPLVCTTPNRHQLAHLPWGFSWGMSGHAVFNLWEFYQYQPTPDNLNRIWPSLGEIGKFYCALMEQCPLVNGKRRMAPSYYPEVGSFGHTNSCYDIVWIKYTLNVARQAAGLMGDVTFSNRCATNLALLPDYTTTTDSSQGGTVIEDWLGAGLQNSVNVAGEVMPVFPAEEVTWFSDQATKDLFARTIQHDENVTARFNSNVTLNMARARLSLPNIISNLYLCFATNSSVSPQQPNGLFFWKGHGYYIAEQMAIARVVSELLMQSAGDVIRVFPAWPTTLDGHFRNLRARGGFLVSADQSAGVATNVTITSTLGGTVSVLNPWATNAGSVRVLDAASHAVAFTTNASNVLTFPTTPGRTYRVEAAKHSITPGLGFGGTLSNGEKNSVRALVQILPTATNGFIHPGIGFTKEILEDARAQVLAGRDPWLAGFVKLAAHPNSARSIKSSNQSRKDPTKPEVDAFDNKSVENRLKQDADKALRQALMYYFTGDTAYRSNAMKIIRIWSQMDAAKYKSYREVYIHCSYPVRDLIAAAELLRYTSSPDPTLAWTEADTANFTRNFVIPTGRVFFDENGWFMNQNGYALAAAISGDIFASDRERYAKRVEWFTVNKTAPNKGWSFSIKDLARLVETNAITGERVQQPQVQLMEMGRDHAHAGDDTEIFNTIVRMMNAQRTKVDPVTGTISTAANAVGPYEFLDDRILAAADHFSRFMLGYDTPWIPAPYDIAPDGKVRGIYPRIADNYRGRIRKNDYWDAYYYYTYQKGIDLAKRTPFYHEAFTKRVVSSDVEWIFIPKVATGECAKVPPAVEEPDVITVVERSTCLSSNVTVKTEGTNSFLRVQPTESGARFAFLSSATASKTISLRIRTTGVATMEMSGFAKSWLLPDTQGEWREVSYRLEKLESWGDIVFALVKGSPQTVVDISQLLRKPNAAQIAPEFAAEGGTLRRVAFVGAPVTLDLKAISSGNKLPIVYASADKPADAALAASTGKLSWQPANAGEVSFIVTAAAGQTLSAQRVIISVANGRAAAIKLATANFNPSTAYVAASLGHFQSARAAAESRMNTASPAEFFVLLEQLQRATDGLELLTPLLPDGSMNFPKLVAASNIGDAIGLLVDGNDDTFPVYFLAKDLNYTFDFGTNFTFSATAFAMEGRLNFEDRMANAKFYGSNDEKNWTELTPAATRATTELRQFPVAVNQTNATFRFLRIQKQGGGLFEPAELRIFGRRQETVVK